MTSKETVNWALMTGKNIDKCLKIVENHDFNDFQLPNTIQDFIMRLSSNHHCDSNVLFFALLSAIGHYGEAIKVFNMEAKQVKPISVYEVLIAPSGSEKSKYINILSHASSQIENYIYANYYTRNKTFKSNNECDQEKQSKVSNYDAWLNKYSSIKQVYTTSSLVQIMTQTSVFFLANEGDAILLESSFFSPGDTTADVKSCTLIDCWDGNQIVKSTVSHGSRVIKNRTVSMCIASTGRRWPDLLREIAKIQMAGGLHERCLYYCFDVKSRSNSEYLSPTAEKQFYDNLYDKLLVSSSQRVQLNYSLCQLLFVIKLLDYRIFIWSKESFSFLQPRLNELKDDRQCKSISDKVQFRTKQHLALRRRSAEHAVRYACLIQTFLNALQILDSMNSDVINSTGGTLTETFEIEAKKTITSLFDEALPREKCLDKDGILIKPLQVNIEAAKSAVAVVFNLLLSQSVHLFNYENFYDVSPNEQLTTIDQNQIQYRNTKSHQIEKFILDLNYKFFHKSVITDRYFRDKRSIVDGALNNLVQHRLLIQSDGKQCFFETGRVTNIKTYLKFLPAADDEDRFRNALLSYDIVYEDYKRKFSDAILSPNNSKLTSYGCGFLSQPQYKSSTNLKQNIGSSSSIVRDHTESMALDTLLNQVDHSVHLKLNSEHEYQSSSSIVNSSETITIVNPSTPSTGNELQTKTLDSELSTTSADTYSSTSILKENRTKNFNEKSSTLSPNTHSSINVFSNASSTSTSSAGLQSPTSSAGAQSSTTLPHVEFPPSSTGAQSSTNNSNHGSLTSSPSLQSSTSSPDSRSCTKNFDDESSTISANHRSSISVCDNGSSTSSVPKSPSTRENSALNFSGVVSNKDKDDHALNVVNTNDIGTTTVDHLIHDDNDSPDDCIKIPPAMATQNANASFEESLGTQKMTEVPILNNNTGRQRENGDRSVMQNGLYGEVLLTPSVLLTRTVINACRKIPSKVLDRVLNYLLENHFIKYDQYLQSGKRKMGAYLKFVPNSIEDPKEKYLLQRKLLDINVDVNSYLKSLKQIRYPSALSRPSNLLLTTLQATPYDQLHIDMVSEDENKPHAKRDKTDEDQSNEEEIAHNDRKKRIKHNQKDIIDIY